MRIIKKIHNRIEWYYNLYIKHDPIYKTFKRWVDIDGKNTLRLNYPLTENSLVFDVGGYEGRWAEKIVDRYNPYIYIFEPVPEYCSLIQSKFADNPKVTVLNYGLSDTTTKTVFHVMGESSSLYRGNERCIEVSLVDVAEVFTEYKIKEIDLIKINIEGAEYPLLRRMIKCALVEKCHDIQVQFHHWISNSYAMRDEILEVLSLTHFPTYQYPFTWENYRKKETEVS